MGFRQLEAAYSITAGGTLNKAVLLALAWHACDECGLCWPGVKLLASETETGTTGVRGALGALTAAGLLAVHRYPLGGRGLSTEYIVLPQLQGLSTAPCAKCRSNMKKPPPADAFPSGNPSPGDAFAGNPSGKATETGSKANARVLTNSHTTSNSQSSASPHQVEPAPAGGPISAPPPSAEMPQSAKDALAALWRRPPPESGTAP